jgi:hypothetical protein
MEKYFVTRTDEETEQLEAIVSKGSHQSSKVINALILLNCDISSGRMRRTGQEVAAVLHVSERKIDRVKKRFVEEGYDAALGTFSVYRQRALPAKSTRTIGQYPNVCRYSKSSCRCF